MDKYLTYSLKVYRQLSFGDPYNPKSTSNELAPILDMGSHEICRKITGSENAGFVRIKTGVNVSQCDMAKKIQGIGIQSDWRRHYPMGRLASHVVGFTGFEDKGLDGIELWYDKELGGLAGQDTYLDGRFADYTGTDQDPNMVITYTSSSIKAVSGVTYANISKVCGVAKASINKVAGLQ